MDGLPFRDRVFDIVIADLGLTARVSSEAAMREVVRVAKPDASVVLVQPVWKAPVDALRRKILSQHLGCPPLTVAEWKRLMREAGLEGLHTEDWSDEATAFRPQITKPFPDFAELFTFSEKLGILRRARRKWGLAGVWSALVRERKVHKVLTQERILGLELVTGVKREAGGMDVEEVAVRSVGGADMSASSADMPPPRIEAPRGGVVEKERVSDLPLFGDKGEASR
jgi:SAM-dependent methyltransferase